MAFIPSSYTAKIAISQCHSKSFRNRLFILLMLLAIPVISLSQEYTYERYFNLNQYRIYAGGGFSQPVDDDYFDTFYKNGWSGQIGAIYPRQPIGLGIQVEAAHFPLNVSKLNNDENLRPDIAKITGGDYSLVSAMLLLEFQVLKNSLVQPYARAGFGFYFWSISRYQRVYTDGTSDPIPKDTQLAAGALGTVGFRFHANRSAKLIPFTEISYLIGMTKEDFSKSHTGTLPIRAGLQYQLEF